MRTSPAASPVLPCDVLPHLALFLSLLVDASARALCDKHVSVPQVGSCTEEMFSVHLGWVKGW